MKTYSSRRMAGGVDNRDVVITERDLHSFLEIAVRREPETGCIERMDQNRRTRDPLQLGSAAGMIEMSVREDDKANEELLAGDLPDDSKNLVSGIDHHPVVCPLGTEDVAISLIGSYHNLPEHAEVLPFDFCPQGA